MFQKRVSAYSVMSEVIAPAAITAQTATPCPRHRPPLVGAREEEPDLAEEARERRDAAEVQGGDEEQDREQRRRLEQAREAVDRRGAAEALDEPGGEEQCRLHRDVVHDVVDRRRVAELEPTAMPKIM